MPIIRLKSETADKAWKALIETREPVHRLPPSEQNLYVVSHRQLARLQQLQFQYEIITDPEVEALGTNRTKV